MKQKSPTFDLYPFFKVLIVGQDPTNSTRNTILLNIPAHAPNLAKIPKDTIILLLVKYNMTTGKITIKQQKGTNCNKLQ